MRRSEAAAQRFKLRSERALASQLLVGESVTVATVIQTGSIATFVVLGLSGIAVGYVYAYLLLFQGLEGSSLFGASVTFAIALWALWVAAFRLGLKPRLLVLTDGRLLLCEMGTWLPLLFRVTGKVVLKRVVRAFGLRRCLRAGTH